MSDLIEFTEPRETQNLPEKVYTAREILVKRILFYLGVALWIVFLSIPFFFMMLAIFQEFSFNLPGDYPDDTLRIWMVMEPDERGIAYSLPIVVERDEFALSVQTTVRYLLWEGEGEFIQYCQFYDRDGSESVWGMIEQSEGICQG